MRECSVEPTNISLNVSHSHCLLPRMSNTNLDYSYTLTYPTIACKLALGKKDIYHEYSEQPEQHVQQFIQIGPPQNLTVTETSVSGEFVASWDPPEHGMDSLRVYIVRWYREPGHYLHGSAETRENYYKGTYDATINTYYVLIAQYIYTFI